MLQPRTTGPAIHAVTLYETVDFLSQDVARFVSEGLASGDRVLVNVTTPHREAVTDRLLAQNVAYEEAVQSGQLVFDDANHLLDAMFVDGRFSRAQCQSVVGAMLAGTTPQRVYGETVALLEERGQLAAALVMEEIEHELAHQSGTHLLCAYNTQQFRPSNWRDAVRAVCRCHDRIEAEPGLRSEEVYRTALTELEEERAHLLEMLRHADARFHLLAAASESLTSTLDFETILRVLLARMMPSLADFGYFDIVDEGAVRRICGAHRDPRRDAILAGMQWERSLRLDRNVCALTSGDTGIHSYIDDEWYRAVATSDAHLDEMRALAFRSMVTVPLRIENSVIGALTLFLGDSGRHYTSDDVLLIEELTRRAAPAVENGRLHRALQREMTRRQEADRRKDEFLAMLGHELRNPLAPIMTALQLMKLRGDDSARRERGVMERQVQHLARLVDDVLDVSRVSSGKISLKHQRFEIAVAAATAVEMAAPLIAERSQFLTVEIPRTGLAVDGDELRIAQVLANLLTNASKYTDPGGHISLKAHADGDVVTIACEDDGAGLPSRLLPRLFDAFSQGERTLDRAQGGLGLGLSLARSLTEMHGGTITAASDGPGKGSTFTVRLPLAVVPVQPPLVRHPSEPVAASPLRALVVNDDEDAANMLVGALTEAGHTALAVYDGAAALAAVEEFGPSAAVIDLGIPVMDGFELARQLRARPDTASLRLVALSRNGQTEDISDARKSGFDAHLVKPSNLEQVLAALRPVVN